MLLLSIQHTMYIMYITLLTKTPPNAHPVMPQCFITQWHINSHNKQTCSLFSIIFTPSDDGFVSWDSEASVTIIQEHILIISQGSWEKLCSMTNCRFQRLRITCCSSSYTSKHRQWKRLWLDGCSPPPNFAITL